MDARVARKEVRYSPFPSSSLPYLVVSLGDAVEDELIGYSD